MAALPATVAGQSLTSRADAGPQATYGDPGIVVSCGVATPDGFGVGSECQVADGVGWYLSPDAAYDDQSLDVTVTAAGFRPRISVLIPARYRPSAVQGVLGDLSPLVSRYAKKSVGCV